MSAHNVYLSPADLDAIANDSTVTVVAAPGVTFEVTSENGWGAPSPNSGVYRFALSPDQIARVRWRRTVTVLPVGFAGSVLFTLNAAGVNR